MPEFLKKLIGDKKKWKAMEARADLLPEDFQILYREMQHYMWKFSAGNGMDIVDILQDVLVLFETGAADGRKALEVTGEDVAAFCDELLRSANTYTENWHDELNAAVRRKLSDGRSGS